MKKPTVDINGALYSAEQDAINRIREDLHFPPEYWEAPDGSIGLRYAVGSDHVYIRPMVEGFDFNITDPYTDPDESGSKDRRNTAFLRCWADATSHGICNRLNMNHQSGLCPYHREEICGPDST